MAKKAKAKKAKAKKVKATKAKKRAVKKTAARKTAARKTAAPRPLGSGAMPRREDVPGISRDHPDLANFREAAIALKVAPFFTGPGAVPFSRLRATQILGPGNRTFNDFFLA